MQAGDPEAIAYYEKAIDVLGDDVGKGHLNLFNDLAISMRKLGKKAEAVRIYDRALALDPGDESVHYNKALALDDLGETAAAMASMRRAITLNPDFYKENHLAAHNIAMICSKAGEHKEALPYLACALRLNPGHENSRALLRTIKASGLDAPAAMSATA